MFVYLLMLMWVIWDDLDAAAQAGLLSYIFVVKLRKRYVRKRYVFKRYVFKRLQSD